MTLPLPNRWLVVASGSCAIAAATCAIAIGAPLFTPEPVAPLVVMPAVPTVVEVVRPEPARAPAPRPRRSCETHVDVTFGFGATAPPPDLVAELAPVLAIARAHPDATLIVDGHADASGDAYQNLLLSKARAHNVAVQLAATGLKHRIVERAFGEFAPTEAPDTEQQRRVRISIHEPHCQEQP